MLSAQQTERMIRRTGGVRVRYAPAVGDLVATYGHRDTADGTVLDELERRGQGARGVSDMLTVATGILPAAALLPDAVLDVETAAGLDEFEPRWVRDAWRVEDGGQTRIALALPR